MSETYNFDYTGNSQSLQITDSGIYLLEVWGAQGGATSTSAGNHNGGYGGYATGLVKLTSGQILYVYVGGQGGSVNRSTTGGTGGFNGGGPGNTGNSSTHTGSAGGGGATHIALVDGLLSTLSTNQSSILCVAGGGGGANGHGSDGYDGGHAGGFSGNKGGCHSSAATNDGATQTTGYAFGQGQQGRAGGSWSWGEAPTGGGGGGWYGGFASQIGNNGTGGGGGGSGYIGNSALISYDNITKHMCGYRVATSADSSTLTYSVTNVSSTATSEYAKSGHGFARITFIGNVGNFTPESLLMMM